MRRGAKRRGSRALLLVLGSFLACGDEGDTLTTATLLPGDPHCPSGGTRLDVKHGDGTTESEYLCNGSNGAQSASLDPPSSVPGTFSIHSGGGTGSAGPGGLGGDVVASMSAGSLGGHVKVFRTGATDASFITPGVATSNLGPVALNVSGGTTVVAARSTVSCSGLAVGAVFTSADTPGPVFHCSPTSQPEKVTGISVAANAVLTFVAQDCAGQGGLPETACAEVNLPAAFRNEGTVSIDASALPNLPPSLSIQPGSYYGESTSIIRVASGLLAIDTTTGMGGLWNKGTLDVSGTDLSAAGGTGGPGGVLVLTSYDKLYNSGSLSAHGGASTGSGGIGGAGGSVALESVQGGINQSATVDVAGGAGAAVGGEGGEILFRVRTGPGSVRSKGDLNAAGGAADSACTSGCAGGNGGRISLTSLSGELLHSARIDSHGGAGGAGPGGSGGEVALTARTGLGSSGGSPVATGNLYVSGEIDTRGGNGGTGGAGGIVAFELDPASAPRGQELILLGYTTIDTHGGEGTTDGGGGGAYTLTNAPSFVEGGLGAGGGVVNEAQVDTSGGSGAAVGGSAGPVLLQSQVANAGTIGYVEPTVNRGSLTLNGGTGGAIGGEGGSAMLEGRTSVDSQGTISVVGGASGPGGGGPGGTCALRSIAGGVTSNAAIHAEGGAVTGTETDSLGGTGGTVLVQGLSVDSKVALTAAGGSGGQGTGGAGGRISLTATSGAVSNTATGFSVGGGRGVAGDGPPGLFFLDGQAIPAP